MHFKLEHTLDSTIDNVEKLMFDKEYYEFLKANHSGVRDIEVIEQTFGQEAIRRQVKYTPKPIIEKVGPKKIPVEAMIFMEHSTYDRGRHRLSFRNVPAMRLVRERMTNEGTISFVQEGAATRRVVEGELVVKFPILGAIAERIIFSQARKLLEEEVACFKRYIVEARKAG